MFAYILAKLAQAAPIFILKGVYMANYAILRFQSTRQAVWQELTDTTSERNPATKATRILIPNGAKKTIISLFHQGRILTNTKSGSRKWDAEQDPTVR